MVRDARLCRAPHHEDCVRWIPYQPFVTSGTTTFYIDGHCFSARIAAVRGRRLFSLPFRQFKFQTAHRLFATQVAPEALAVPPLKSEGVGRREALTLSRC